MIRIKEKKICFLVFTFFLPVFIFAQMNQNGKTLFGNEWIDQSKTYHRFYVNEDGIYRISNKKLQEIGITSSDIERLQIWNFGKQIAINIESGYIEFVGYRNTIGLDTFLYENWKKDLLNEDYSLITDDNAYYLSIAKEGEPVLRYKKVTTPGSSNYPRLQSFQYNQKINLVSTFYKPEIAQLKYSHFVSSEGFTDGLKNDFSRSILTPNRALSGDVTLYYSTSTSSNFKQLYDVSLNGKSIKTDSVGFLTTNKVRINLNNGDLQENNTLRIKGQNANLLLGVSHVSLIYPRTFNMSGITFTTIKNPESEPRLIEFQQLSDQINYFYDITNQQVVQISAANKSVVIEGNGNLIYSSNTREVNNFEKITPFNLPSNLSYLIVSSKKLAKTPRGQEGLDRYKAYRNSSKGGRFTSEVVYVEDIYDFFGYGVPNHPHTFKNFAHFLKANYPSMEYVLLVGKGREYNTIRTKEQLNQASNQTFFIPTYGNSPSDILLFSKAEEAVPFFALGRIAAKNGDDINNYLDKVIEHDLAKEAPQTLEKMWLKNVIHLGGGANNGEQSAIKRFLEQMGDTLVNSQFGARINGFYKTTTASVQTANVDGIYKNLNNGSSIITFFGHASVGTFDFTLDSPNNYQNKGKYPFIFSLGCYSGNIHTTASGISEDFVFAKERGAIGFIAAAGTATLYSQGIYGVDYYKKLGNDFYGKSIGQMLNLIVEQNKNVRAIDPFTFYQQLTLNGDPAVSLASFEKPDYTFDIEKVSTEPSQVFAENNSFDLNLGLANIGRFTGDSIKVEINIEKNNSIIYKLEKYILSPKNLETLTTQIPINEDWVGEVVIKAQITNLGSNSESSTSNNTLINKNGINGFPLVINSNNIKNIFPYDNSIIGSIEEFKLLAKTQNAFAKPNNYRIQIDTSYKFNSPFKQEKVFNNNGSFIEWKPNIPLIENQTYYWRTCIINESENSTIWDINSFTYISNKKGFLLQTPFQFSKGKLENMEFDSTGRLDFKIVDFNLNIRSAQFQGEIIFNTANGNKWGTLTPFNGSSNTLNAYIWRKNGLKQNNGTDYNTVKWNSNTFVFNLSTLESRKGLMDLINSAEEEDVIFCFFNFLQSGDLSSFQHDKWETDTIHLGKSLYSYFKEYGALSFENLKSGLRPYILSFTKKNGIIAEIISDKLSNPVATAIKAPSRVYNGEIESAPIKTGPNLEILQILQEDKVGKKGFSHTSLYYNTPNNKTFRLYKDSLRSSSIDLKDLKNIGVESIKLKFYSLHGGDGENGSVNGALLGENSSQLYKWMITTNEVLPDLIFASGKLSKEEFYQGEKINSDLTIYNNSNRVFDNIEIKIDQINSVNSTNSVINNVEKINPGLNSIKQLLGDKAELGILGYAVEINSNKSPNEFDFDNNRSNTFIKVKKDNINPNIEVLFNGSTIIDGDYVNSKPIIKISISDDNKFLLINKPELISIGILNNTTKDIENISLINDRIAKFIPANDSTNKAVVEIYKEFADGNYTLIVNSKDGAGNVSGNQNYEVSFNVSSKSYIKNLTNYPNPFSNKTQFVYEMVGNLPDDFVLQIFSISGKIVKEFRAAELGSIKNGKNVSSLVWDGTDDFGNKLGNGVYLMRMKTNFNKDYFDSSTNNNYMYKGFSKLVITR